ncbi:hypothetical protein [Gordonia malaquae]|uniref:hypothetical protein n=1 Tax=Gordonia malaquae TaxID=410332 RepID=UPI00301A260E
MSDMWTLRDKSAGSKLTDERFPDPKSADDRTRSVIWSGRHWVILSPSGTVMADSSDRRPSPLDQVIWDHPTFDTATLLAKARAALEEDSGDTEAAMLVECIAELERLTAMHGDWKIHRDELRADRDRAQAWAAWFAAERDFYLRDYDENARWHHRRTRQAEAALDRLVEAERAARVEYQPHRWRWINGFWAECSCGLRENGFLAPPIRRRMEKHVISATAADLAAAQIREARQIRAVRRHS